MSYERKENPPVSGQRRKTLTLRTQQIQEERPTDPVDELISTVAHAPTKKVKVVNCKCHEER